MRYIFLLLLTSIAVIANAQDEHVNEARQTVQKTFFQECDFTGSTTNFPLKSIPVGARFTIIGKNAGNDKYIINFWDWEDDLNENDEDAYRKVAETADNVTKMLDYKSAAPYNSSANQQTRYYLDLNYRPMGEPRYFLIPSNKLDDVSKPLYKRWSAIGGAMTFPFKYRPQSGIFEKTFALSFVGGGRWLPRRTDDNFSISFMGGVGASSVTLTKDNTDANSGVTDATDRAAVTLSGHCILQWEKIQVAFSVGIDNRLDGNKENWDYQGRGWMSVGIGVGIFNNSEVKAAGTNKVK